MPADLYFTLGAGSKDVVDRFVQFSLLTSSHIQILRSVEKVAQKHGATMAQVSLAWLMAKDGGPELVPLYASCLLKSFGRCNGAYRRHNIAQEAGGSPRYVIATG
jgi:hypothetical protein